MCDEAMTIANRLEEHDLFMDLFHYANTSDNSSLASLAWRKAEQILAEDVMADHSSSDYFRFSSRNCVCRDAGRASDSLNFCACYRFGKL